MKNPFATFLRQQILVMVGLSLLPGIGYIFLGWYYGNAEPAIIWYLLNLLISIWGVWVYKNYYSGLDPILAERSYQKMSYFFYVIFMLWSLIFILYVNTDIIEMHYIAIFTQLGASVVASTLLVSDKKLYYPIIAILMLPLSLYFSLIGEWYSYILSIFALIFMGVLYYSSHNSNTMLSNTYYQANHDTLTGIRNRRYIIKYLKQLMNKLNNSNSYSYIILIDLDHFKTINDSLGHDVGDMLLIEVTDRIKSHLKSDATFARLGGDEFIVVGSIDSDLDFINKHSQQTAEAILEQIKIPYEISGNQLRISASIGISILDHTAIDANAFIKEADIAMYEAKKQGRDGILLFNKDMSVQVEKHLEMERLLHFALQNGEIYLNYQPQYNLENRIIGCEVLMRWKSNKLGNVSPADFIPIAEQTGLILDLGAYVLEESFKTLVQWHQQGIHLEQFSINISVRQVFCYTFVDDIKSLCDTYLSKDLRQTLIFEITESVVAEDIDTLIRVINELSDFGIRFSMDDFGTGYSSLSFLKQLPIHELKIDRSFVNQIENDMDQDNFIVIINQLAKNLGLSVVAEGAETKDQVEFLTKKGCDVLQGYFLSKPLLKDDFTICYKKEEHSN
jgi:diguanylate cyclase (GGDEF)-like protein